MDAHDILGLRLLGASRAEIVTKLLLPSAAPWVFTGMRVAVRYALTATILGELIAANRGLGFLIEANAGQFNASGVFAGVAVVVAMGMTITAALTRLEKLQERRLKASPLDALAP